MYFKTNPFQVSRLRTQFSISGFRGSCLPVVRQRPFSGKWCHCRSAVVSAHPKRVVDALPEGSGTAHGIMDSALPKRVVGALPEGSRTALRRIEVEAKLRADDLGADADHGASADEPRRI